MLPQRSKHSLKKQPLLSDSVSRTHCDNKTSPTLFKKHSTWLACLGVISVTLSGCQTENQQHSQSAHSPLIHAQNSADNKSDNRTKQVNYSYGSRPFYLIDDMDDSPLKQELQACEAQTPKKTDFSISHRGAPLQYPEHTLDGYMAAARMGAGVLECDVAFTKDHELVCRHAQNDLHTTTNILTTPLANHVLSRLNLMPWVT
ncbi:glycerophosphodiester phosphodiesterase family protein [Psychrobacter sp. FDAARGOS_221]|uniref:glycerophosphodiester phosphodiesterase family protein n=1 Tax=Psychrobacter sp. FDAARGOS_221 TaxID=1975705 RepID=UPI00222870C7|nr:glycerophosphodiester phosphodiesterase family protein [Psychrobacter sp. FDAARGOS_221]